MGKGKGGVVAVEMPSVGPQDGVGPSTNAGGRQAAGGALYTGKPGRAAERSAASGVRHTTLVAGGSDEEDNLVVAYSAASGTTDLQVGSTHFHMGISSGQP